ncbi:hypothetical protein ACPA9J_30375 [Pseudomonas aeruginosa]
MLAMYLPRIPSRKRATAGLAGRLRCWFGLSVHRPPAPGLRRQPGTVRGRHQAGREPRPSEGPDAEDIEASTVQAARPTSRTTSETSWRDGDRRRLMITGGRRRRKTRALTRCRSQRRPPGDPRRRPGPSRRREPHGTHHPGRVRDALYEASRSDGCARTARAPGRNGGSHADVLRRCRRRDVQSRRHALA